MATITFTPISSHRKIASRIRFKTGPVVYSKFWIVQNKPFATALHAVEKAFTTRCQFYTCEALVHVRYLDGPLKMVQVLRFFRSRRHELQPDLKWMASERRNTLVKVSIDIRVSWGCYWSIIGSGMYAAEFCCKMNILFITCLRFDEFYWVT